MDIEILYQILLIVSIVVGILLIANLVRLYITLAHLNEVTGISRRRVKELDASFDHAKSILDSFVETVKAFVASLDAIKYAQRKFSSFLDKDDKVKENKKDEQR